MSNENEKQPQVPPSELQKTEAAKPAMLVSVDNSEFNCYLDTAKFNQLFRAAQLLASTEIVPVRYQKKPADCFVAMQMAIRMQTDPLMFMQNTYVVQGRPGMEAKFVIALINNRGPFKGPVQWEFKGQGNSRACTAYATHKITNEVCKATVSWDMAEKEGWTKKNGSKWQTMPDLMFQYRSASFLANLYCPEVKMGMMTVEEIIDIEPENFEAAQNKANQRIKDSSGSRPIDTAFEEPAAGTEQPENAGLESQRPQDDTPPQKLPYYCPVCDTEHLYQKGNKCPMVDKDGNPCTGKLIKQ